MVSQPDPKNTLIFAVDVFNRGSKGPVATVTAFLRWASGWVGGGLLRSVAGWSALNVIRSRSRCTINDERILGNGPKFVESPLRQARRTMIG